MSCKNIDYVGLAKECNLFQIKMEVRDYECDHQGIVNNAIYHNYFEHARHKFLIKQGIDFNDLIKKNIFLVVFRTEIDYLMPLKSKDDFMVSVKYKNISKLKGVFEQEIIMLKNKKKLQSVKL